MVRRDSPSECRLESPGWHVTFAARPTGRPRHDPTTEVRDVATAVVEERQLLKTLRWYDGFVIALANPGFLLGSLGYSVGDLGGWGAALLWGSRPIVAVFINTLYSELAAMFPDKSGGLALYAHEGGASTRPSSGRSRRSATGSAGRSCSRSTASSSARSSRARGSRASRTAGASTTRTSTGYFSTGTVKVGLPQLIAIGLILAVWLFNVCGVARRRVVRLPRRERS